MIAAVRGIFSGSLRIGVACRGGTTLCLRMRGVTSQVLVGPSRSRRRRFPRHADCSEFVLLGVILILGFEAENKSLDLWSSWRDG
jgi:hypothetical protein